MEPYRLVFRSKAWYLYAYCHLRQDFRFFKLTRIREIEVLTETFVRKISSADTVEEGVQIENTVPVTLKFDKEMAFRVYDEFAGEIMEDLDGSLYVRTRLPDSEVMFRYLFSFAEGVEIIEPAHIRTQMSRKLAEMQNKYKT